MNFVPYFRTFFAPFPTMSGVESASVASMYTDITDPSLPRDAAITLASMADKPALMPTPTIINIIAPHDRIGPMPLLPMKPRVPTRSVLKGKIVVPASNVNKAAYKTAFKNANGRISALEIHVTAVYEKAVEDHAACGNVLKHTYKALEKKQGELLKTVREVNGKQEHISEQKIHIEVLQKQL